jgi:hypothetical protein
MNEEKVREEAKREAEGKAYNRLEEQPERGSGGMKPEGRSQGRSLGKKPREEG